MPEHQIRRALISVYDKTGIVEFARALVEEFGIEIISTGGTAALLKEKGIPVTLVEEVTGFPEMLDGRVKTLHPKIHAAILADRDNPEHMRQLEEQGIKPIDMVVVNLYPFEKTVADPNCTFEQAIEMIDIGGPCLLRAAAKNHRHVLVLATTAAYRRTLQFLRGDTSKTRENWRSWLMTKAFQETTSYDIVVHRYFADHYWKTPFPPVSFLDLSLTIPTTRNELRYGENPHQRGTAYGLHPCAAEPSVESASFDFEEIEPSFNNYVDADAALELCKELNRAGRAKILFARTTEQVPTGDLGSQSTKTIRQCLEPVVGERMTWRKLPHWQVEGATYFVTFRSAIGTLTEAERDLVLAALRHWDGTKLDLHAATVMPDHVHALLTPRPIAESADAHQNLSALMQSIKAHTGREISKMRGGSASQIWIRESYDRWMRSEEEFIEKWAYIANNPVKEGLTDLPQNYRWWYGVEEPMGARPNQTGSAVNGPQQITGKEDLCPTFICVYIKHTNACGVGIAAEPIAAYARAYLGDPTAAMGGILACNFTVDSNFATAVTDTYDRWGKKVAAGGFFVEVWVASSFDQDAVQTIRTRKSWGERVRLLSVGDMAAPPDEKERDYKKITGGMLVQTRDLIGLNEEQWKVVTKRAPSESEIADLRLAWLIAKHTKSNAISMCKDGMLIGNGAGQMSRVMSCRIAAWLAKENGHTEKLKGSAAASDAFFPFADGPTLLMDAGVSAIIQPGGSKRDEETIKACDERGAAMIFTGTRHFKH